MRILRLKLVNFIGIMHGLGIDTIEIDFTLGNNKIVMLRGGNGSGKSTIMSQLHPYKDSFDDRKKLILDGKDGLKEIDIEHNGHKYEISHTYAKMAQSFIKEDGVELNENGGVKTFEDIVSKKLGITKDFFQIGKIGSNTKNFVDLPAVERKEYIGKFLNIEDILEAYKHANDKLKEFKKDISTVGTELQKFSSKDIVENEITRLEESLKTLETDLTALYTEQGSLQTIINRDTAIINGRTEDALVQALESKKTEYSKYKDIKTELEEELEDINDPSATSKKLSEEIYQLQSDIQVNNNEVNNKNLLLTDLNNKVSSLNIQLSSIGSPEDIVKLNNEISELEAELSELGKSIKSNPVGKLVNDLIKNRKDISKLLHRFTVFTDFIEKYYNELGARTFAVDKTNIEYFFDDDFNDAFNRQIEESRRVIDGKEKLLEEFQKERGIKEGYICQLENLNKRPMQCTIDDCPFIKSALEHRNVLSEIASKDEDIKQVKKDIDDLSIKVDNLQALQALYCNFQEVYKDLMPRDNDIYIEFIRDKSLMEWVSGMFSTFQSERQVLIENINKAVEDIDSYRTKYNKLQSCNTSKKVLEDSGSNIRTKYLDDIKEAEGKIAALTAEIDGLKETGKKLSDQLLIKQTLRGKYDALVEARSKVDSNSTMVSSKKTELETFRTVLAELTASELRLQEVLTEISNKSQLKISQSNEILNHRSALANIDSLSKRKTKLEKEYKPIDTITKALSPKGGIPLVFINSYLAETQAIANDLLKIAFNGEFQINFATAEREFNIQVISKNNLKPDIKMASQGEVAITTISISLALIEQSIGAYNIICLDEIDGPLDINNRTNFIDILNSQISKLGIEQVFVISHNDAFDAAPLDLILLKDNNVNKNNAGFMANKTIIFENEGI